MKIYIDPGHGGSNPGATYKNRKESEDVYRLALRVKQLLEAQGVTVKMSRTADTDPELTARTNEANAWKADYFLSIHRNAFGPNKAHGMENWVYSKVETDGVTYSLAKHILDSASSAGNFTNRGVKKGAPNYTDYAVNRQTVMSSCLLEAGFIDSDTDNENFDKNFEAMAQAIAKAVTENGGMKYILPGDIDGDGKITAADARLALRAAVDAEKLTAAQEKAADINGDGKITSADAREILKKATE